jgi:TatD DNase family protein
MENASEKGRLRLVDTHAHLDDERFQHDLPQVLERAVAMGVERIVTIGIDVATSKAAVALAQQHDLLRSAVGIQPNHVHEAQSGDWDEIVRLAGEPGVVAVGESGLDRHWDRAPFPLQEEYFARHLELARTIGKPIVIHCREAEVDVLKMLRTAFDAHGPISGIMHSYSGNVEQATLALEMGLHISFAGMVTYKTADKTRKVAAMVPDDRILVETDSPYLAPVPNRGKRNEPAWVAHTAAWIAEIRSISVERLGEITTANAGRLLGF